MFKGIKKYFKVYGKYRLLIKNYREVVLSKRFALNENIRLHGKVLELEQSLALSINNTERSLERKRELVDENSRLHFKLKEANNFKVNLNPIETLLESILDELQQSNDNDKEKQLR